MFSDSQKEALAAPLDGSIVRERSQAGRKFSYIEGWWAIHEANRIFGFDGWDRETVELRQVCEPYQNQNKNHVVAYMARVRVTVCPGTKVVREGSGTGSGISKDLGDAHESAIKEAETDAMKRALMTFGNQFGLALYDKDRRDVTNDTTKPATAFGPLTKTQLTEKLRQFAGDLPNCEDSNSLAGLLKSYAEPLAQCKRDMPSWYFTQEGSDTLGLGDRIKEISKELADLERGDPALRQLQNERTPLDAG